MEIIDVMIACISVMNIALLVAIFHLGKRVDRQEEATIKIVEELELSVVAIWAAMDKDLARIKHLEERIKKIQKRGEG
jgi:uncharacterized coiled-coil protein SlyX